MTFPEIAIKRYRVTIIALLVLMLAGITGFLNTPQREDPVVDPKECSLYVIYPGASPDDMENLILNPLETAINGIENIKEMNGHAGDSFCSINVKFDWSADADDATDEVRAKLNEMKASLPEGIYRAEVVKHGTERAVILQIAVVSEVYSAERLYTWADNLSERITRVNGVRSADLDGGQTSEVRVSVNPEELAQREISLVQVVGALGQENATIPAGSVVSGNMEFAVRTDARFETLDQVRNTIVGASAAGPVYLHEVATVHMGYEDPTYVTRYNGKPCVFVSVTQTPGSNIPDIYEGVQIVLNQTRRDLPEDVGLHIVSNLPEDVNNRLSDFAQNLLIGTLLVGLVIFPILGFQMSAVVMFTVPSIIVIALGFLNIADVEMHQITIAALILVLGMLVDNSIVVVQNIYRHHTVLGKSIEEAAGSGTNEVIWPVVASTATIITVFLAMMAVTGVTGDYIQAVPLTVAFTLISSLMMALSVVPLLTRGLMKLWKSKSMSRKSPTLRAFEWVQNRLYTPLLNAALNHRLITLLIIVAAIGVTGVTASFLGSELFPKADKPQIMISIEVPRGTSIQRTDELTRRVEQFVAAAPEVDYYASNVGKGNPAIYVTYARHQEATNFAEVFVRLKVDDDLRSQSEIVRDFRRELSTWSEGTFEVKEFVMGPPVGAPVAIRIEGPDLATLQQYSDSVTAVLRQMDGPINIHSDLKPGSSDLRLRIDANKARILGVSNVLLAQTLRVALSGVTATTMRMGDEDYNVVVRLPTPEGRKLRPEDLERIYIPTSMGTQVPLREVVRTELTGGYGDIYHYEQERCVTIRADLDAGYLVSEIIAGADEHLRHLRLPEGYKLSYTGETEESDALFADLTRALLMALVVIFGILVLMFNSYVQPVAIFATIPLAFIGVVLTLFLSGHHFGFMTYIGVMSLAGIVVNNAIVLIDFINSLREQGTPAGEAIRQAGALRFAPILMTSFTTVFGLMPLALRGGPLWEPMAWTIIGGLLFSTLLTLVVVPVLYSFTVENNDTAEE